MSIFSGLECTDATYPILTGVDMPECWYDSAGHKTTKGGQGFVPAGETKAGFMQNFETLVFPTKTNAVIEQSAAYDRAWIRAGAALNASLLEDPEGNQPNYWIWDNPASLALVNKDGSPFYFHGNYLYAQATYSHNGRWLLLFDESGYLIRIDLEQLTISTYRITEGQDVFWPAIAISDSGRYIAVNDRIDQFFIMDTEGCTDLQTHIDIPAHVNTCTKRSLRDYALEYFDGLHQAWMEFYGDHIARVKGLSKDGQTGEEIIIRAPNTRLGTNYIALGDSYSSGEGAYEYLPGTDEANNRCHLSRDSYPFLLNRWLGLDSTHSVACSGAKIHNVIGGHPNQAAQNHKPPADQSLGYWLPGYRWQGEFIRNPDTPVDIVTIGISGNDIGFADKLKTCIGIGTCFSSTYDRVGIALEINYQFERLVNTYSFLRREALKKSPAARVYAVGYPQIFSGTGSKAGKCAVNVRLSLEEIQMAGNLITYLNGMIRQAAKRAGVVYVSVEGALDGHKHCETRFPAVRGLSTGNGVLPYNVPLVAIESYHPTSHGHELLAKRIQEATREFRETMPRPDRTAEAPDPLRNSLVTNASDMSGEMRRLIYGGNISSETVIKGTNQYLFLDGSYNLKVGSKGIVMYRSEPTLVGEFSVDTSGNLATNYVVPDTLDPGIHTLHILAETSEDELIDIYKTVYVAATNEDWDGDGIPNVQDPCVAFAPAGVDTDHDEIDDGCDDFIAPAISLPPSLTTDTSTGGVEVDDSGFVLNSGSWSNQGSDPTNGGGSALENDGYTPLDSTSSSSLSSRVFVLALVAALMLVTTRQMRKQPK